MHSPGHLLLTNGDDFTSHGSMFKDATSQFLVFTSHGSNSQEFFLSHQFASVSLHGSYFHLEFVYVFDSIEKIHVLPKMKISPNIIHLATFYVPNQVENIPLLPKRKIPLDIII